MCKAAAKLFEHLRPQTRHDCSGVLLAKDMRVIPSIEGAAGQAVAIVWQKQDPERLVIARERANQPIDLRSFGPGTCAAILYRLEEETIQDTETDCDGRYNQDASSSSSMQSFFSPSSPQTCESGPEWWDHHRTAPGLGGAVARGRSAAGS